MSDDQEVPVSDATKMLVALAEGMAPMVEAAAGIKAQALTLGFTEETAEAAGREFILGVLRKAFK